MKRRDCVSNASQTARAKTAATMAAAVRAEHVPDPIFVPTTSVSTVRPVFPNAMIGNAATMNAEVHAGHVLPEMYAATITA